MNQLRTELSRAIRRQLWLYSAPRAPNRRFHAVPHPRPSRGFAGTDTHYQDTLIGAKVHLTESISAGVSFRSPQWIVSASVNLKQLQVSQNDSGLAIEAFDVDAEYRDRLPYRLSAGLAYQSERELTLSAELERRTSFLLIMLGGTFRFST